MCGSSRCRLFDWSTDKACDFFRVVLSALSPCAWALDLMKSLCSGTRRALFLFQLTALSHRRLSSRHQGDAVVTDVEGVREAVETSGAENVLCVVTTTSCFAPRLPDKVYSFCSKPQAFVLEGNLSKVNGVISFVAQEQWSRTTGSLSGLTEALCAALTVLIVMLFRCSHATSGGDFCCVKSRLGNRRHGKSSGSVNSQRVGTSSLRCSSVGVSKRQQEKNGSVKITST